ncbi:MAG: hypothetical protein AAB609_02880 [Patescibacteria group bacterium]
MTVEYGYGAKRGDYRVREGGIVNETGRVMDEATFMDKYGEDLGRRAIIYFTAKEGDYSRYDFGLISCGFAIVLAERLSKPDLSEVHQKSMFLMELLGDANILRFYNKKQEGTT